MNNAALAGGAAERNLENGVWRRHQDNIPPCSPQQLPSSWAGGCPILSPEECSAICREAALLHACGVRPLAEFLIELANQHGVEFTDDLVERLQAYTHIPASVYRLFGGDKLPAPPVHEVV